jgi:hypothetical protein
MLAQMSGARDLATRAHEMGASVLRGELTHHGQDGWAVNGQPVAEWLAEYQGQQVYLIAIATTAKAVGADDRRTCRTCGRDYEGSECPYCRETRLRLRGR